MFGPNETWANQQIDRCVNALSSDGYATHVPTDDKSVDEVVETIAKDFGLTLTQPRLSTVAYQRRRISVGLRHVRR